jgi:aminoglycoside phosphotransferase (APT) family kinase protein
MVTTMHEGETPVDESLARRFIASQFPEWSTLPLRYVEPAGTDHAIYRLGDDMAARFPRIDWAAGQPAKEHEWLPRIAPHLSIQIPEPLGLGEPEDGYPFQWLVCSWVPGENATPARLSSLEETVTDIVTLLHELWSIETTGGPAAQGRGGDLTYYDEDCRASILQLNGTIDTDWALEEWEMALDTPQWTRDPVWLHRDLDARNLLARNGRLSGLIDFGGLAVGDPAADLMVAWKMFDADGRARLRSSLDLDEDTWHRARGCVLCQAVMILSYYTMETNPTLVREAGAWLTELASLEG